MTEVIQGNWETHRIHDEVIGCDLPGCVAISKGVISSMAKNLLVVQPKLDGHRKAVGVVRGGESGMCVPIAIGKRESSVTFQKIDIFSKLPDHLKEIIGALPTNTVLDCEIYLPGKEASDVSHAISEKDPNLQIAAFGLLWYKGGRYFRGILDAMEIINNLIGFPTVETWGYRWDKSHFLSEYNSILRSLQERVKAEGREGFVIKSTSWDRSAKWKLMRTWDVVVTGVQMANPGKFQGLIGALICSIPDPADPSRLIEVCKCSGMTDKKRIEFTRFPPIGKVIEVSAQGISPNGRLRHPQYKGVRYDKQAKDCKPLAEQM